MRIVLKSEVPVCVNHESYEYTAVVMVYESLFLLLVVVLVIWLSISLGYVMRIIN